MIIALTIVQVLIGVTITFVVLAQSGKSAGLSGAIAGAADSFLSKNKSRSLDSRLAGLTKWFALAFVLLTLVLNMLAK